MKTANEGRKEEKEFPAPTRKKYHIIKNLTSNFYKKQNNFFLSSPSFMISYISKSLDMFFFSQTYEEEKLESLKNQL